MYRAKIRNNLISQSNTNVKEASPGPFESEINEKNGSQNSSIICPHSLELMNLLYLTWCGKKTIQMQMGTSPIILTRRLHVSYKRAITMKLIVIKFT